MRQQAVDVTIPCGRQAGQPGMRLVAVGFGQQAHDRRGTFVGVAPAWAAGATCGGRTAGWFAGHGVVRDCRTAIELIQAACALRGISMSMCAMLLLFDAKQKLS